MNVPKLITVSRPTARPSIDRARPRPVQTKSLPDRSASQQSRHGRARVSAHHPTGRHKMDLSATHVGIEGAPDRLDHSRPSRAISLVEDATDGTKPRQECDQLLLRQAAGNIDRLNFNAGPVALLQDAV